MPVHTLHTQESGIAVRNCGQAHKRTADDRVDFTGKFDHFVAQAQASRTAADIDIRLLRLHNERHRLVDFFFRNLGQGDFFHYGLRLVFIGSHLHVLGDIHKDRARSARLCNLEGLTNGIRKVFNALYKEVVLGDGNGNARDVDFLEAVLPDERTGHVARDCHHRNGIKHRGCNPRYKVGCARARSCQADAHLTRCTGIAVGSVRSTLLVRGQNMVDFVLIFIQRVVDIDYLTAGIPEYVGYPLLNQGFN